jgi:hypothetical protein
MGESKSPEQLGLKLAAAATAIATANRKAVSRAALVYKDRLIAASVSDTGGDRRLSRWKARGGTVKPSPRLGAGYDIKGNENAVAIVRPRPYGIWALLEGGAVAHPIKPYRRGKAKGGGLAFPDGNVRRAVEHPGTQGKRTFTKAKAGAQGPAMRVFAAVHRKSLLEVFK